MPENPTLERLEDQIKWYDGKSIKCQNWFKRLKLTEIAAAAVIPFAAGFEATPILTGGLGVLVVILEGLQNMNQYQKNWTRYRSTCEELKHEKYLWLAKAGSYMNLENPDALLAERIESLISREHTSWISVQDQVEKHKQKT